MHTFHLKGHTAATHYKHIMTFWEPAGKNQLVSHDDAGLQLRCSWQLRGLTRQSTPFVNPLSGTLGIPFHARVAIAGRRSSLQYDRRWLLSPGPQCQARDVLLHRLRCKHAVSHLALALLCCCVRVCAV